MEKKVYVLLLFANYDNVFHTIRKIIFFIPQAILLSDSSSDEDEDPQISEAELQNMLKLHKYQRKHQMQFYQDPEVIH